MEGADVWDLREKHIQCCLFVVDQGLARGCLVWLRFYSSLHTSRPKLDPLSLRPVMLFMLVRSNTSQAPPVLPKSAPENCCCCPGTEYRITDNQHAVRTNNLRIEEVLDETEEGKKGKPRKELITMDLLLARISLRGKKGKLRSAVLG